MWIAYALSGAVITAVFIVMSKKGLEDAKPAIALAIQSAVALTVSITAAVYRGEHRSVTDFDRKIWLILVGSGVLVGVASLCRFLALGLSDASKVTPLDQLSLVFTTILAMLFLGEGTNWKVWTGVALMIAGAATISLGAPKKDKPEEKQDGGSKPESAEAASARHNRPMQVGSGV